MSFLQIHEPGQTPAPHAKCAVGIDLGTTHSVVAIAEGGAVRVLKDSSGQALLPSVVYYAPDGSIEVGESARRRRALGDANAIASVKRLMGRGEQEVKPVLGKDAYQVSSQEGFLALQAGGRDVTPVEVSAEILKRLKQIAEQALSREVSQAVITVPAYFDDAARAATKDAGRLAGLEVLRLVNEPTAAALAYGLDNALQGVYAVYDLGGGTFDLSLLKLEGGIFQVLATAGDTALGGDDFDEAIAAWILAASEMPQAGINSGEIGRLVAVSRQIKHTLSSDPKAVFNWNNRELTLTREGFNKLVAPYVERTLEVCERALADAGLATTDIIGVVMVGGSTRVPLVQSEVGHFFNTRPLTDVNPDEVVAAGAALQAALLTGSLSGEAADSLLLDVIPLSLGLETMGGITEKIIQRNTPIPVSVAQEFTTYQDNQTGIQVHVVQGEREMVSDNRSLARFELAGIPPLPAGIARVRIAFTVDADGILTVTAEEKTTGASQSVNVKPSYGLPPEKIEEMLLESVRHAREDITGRLLAEARVEAERAILELQSVLKEQGLASEAEIARINRQIQVVHNAMDGDDRDYIDVELAELSRMAQPIAERRMDRAVALALKGAHIDSVEN